MFDLDASTPPELVPLSWLIGVWEGTGVLDYRVGDDTVSHEFGQRVSFSHDGGSWLNYSSISWLLDDPSRSPLTAEAGYWRLRYEPAANDAGPGMLPGTGARRFGSAEAVETLRTDNGFEIEASIIHPDGVDELYIGHVNGPRIDLVTDAVMRSSTAKEYTAATRLYGLVESHLLWAWDIAALGQDLRSHASARLARTE
ncbi:FABP family protein [Ruicaihuangia caeni]|uniref:Peroxynitrite isomerase n=1 Tax=Ruicaihuangia caeni TaxID=3042517 RepID=A0AAW6T684_9MICO|nr:FABP family protein [Klugiella sp. YN-L-19]MDI2098739.1 FABP family protein [Klugiella sp. YN-L-19]